MSDLLKYRQELIEGLQALDFNQIRKAADVIFGAWQRDSSVYIFGNGHSASTSEAFAADLRKWPQTRKHRGVRAHALTLLPLMTAYANDVSYEDIFIQQLTDVVEDGDVAIGLTCGGSKNVLYAFQSDFIKENCISILITGPIKWSELWPPTTMVLGSGYFAKIAIEAHAPDIRQQEDLMSIIAHMICGEVKAHIVHFVGEDNGD